jgi:hypothetical protein
MVSFICLMIGVSMIGAVPRPLQAMATITDIRRYDSVPWLFF